MDENYRINQSVEKVLFKAYHMENRIRNRILLWAITAVVMVSFCLTDMIYRKTQADMLKFIRSDGVTVSAYLENGTENTLWQLKNLPYVKNTGLKKYAGKLMDSQRICCSCIFLDPPAYEQMTEPVFLEVHGSYPQKTDEIMLSQKTLEDMGIESPKTGMKLSLEFYWNDLSCNTLTGKQDFILSGYYTDAKDTLLEEPEAYISEARLEACSMQLFPCRILIDTNKNHLDGAKTEKILYRDLLTENDQQIVCMDSAFYRAVEKSAGGCGAAFLLLTAIVLVLFLFVYNVCYLSMEKDIRQYGLLRVLGMPDRQIKRIVYIQTLQVCLTGNAAGIFLAFIMVRGILDRMIVETDSLESGGKIWIVRGVFLLVICLLVSIVVLLATHILLNKVLAYAPVQAVRFENVDQAREMKGRVRERKHRKEWCSDAILQIAWKNMMRSKKKFLLIVCSLALGCETALLSVVIGKGTDPMNELQKNPDFEIRVTHEFCTMQIESSLKMESLLSDDMIFQIEALTGIPKEAVSKTEGFLPIIDRKGRESLQLLNLQDDPVVVIQKMDIHEVEQLKQYAKDKTGVDLDLFLNQNGVLILHRHLLSESAEENAETYIGKDVGIYDLVPVGTDMSGFDPVPLVNCGYLDMTDRAFPELELLWNGERTICMAVSGDTFEMLRKYLTPQTFQLSFDMEPDIESEVKKILNQWMRTINMGNVDRLSLTCNSDRIIKEQQHIQSAQFTMEMVSLIFLFLGILNYLNAMLTDFVIRSREFAIMRDIGLTEKQIKRMLTWEGLLYCFMTAGILGTAGSGILYLMGKYMRGRISYFEFQYPLSAATGIFAALLLVCCLIPHGIYRLRSFDRSG